MFDGVSLGKMLVVLGAGTFFVGKKELPSAFRFAGSQLGRVVGLLQGGRARADRFAVSNEMRGLQQELRSGMRELDAVRGELAIATSSGMFGRELASGGRRPSSAGPSSGAGAAGIAGGSATNAYGVDYRKAAAAAAETGPAVAVPSEQLAPRSHSVAAVAEEEWEKRGIGFTSRAEAGTRNTGPKDGGGMESPRGGSFLLADIMQQTLIHDQYDRAVQEQDDILRSRADKIRPVQSGGEDSTPSPK